MESNDYSGNGGQPPNPHNYPVNGYPNNNDYNANYSGYPGYNYPAYGDYAPPPNGDLNAQPPPANYPQAVDGYQYPQEPYQQDLYQQSQYHHDPAYHFQPHEQMKLEPMAYQHEHIPPQQQAPPIEEPQQEPPKQDILPTHAPAQAPSPAIPEIPTTATNEVEDDKSMEKEGDANNDDQGNEAQHPPEELPEGDVFNFDTILSELQKFRNQHGTSAVPVNHPAFTRIIDSLIMNGVEDEANKRWEHQYELLKAYKETNGDCDVPFTDETLGEWISDQRKMHAEKKSDPLSKSRFEKLAALGFEWDRPMWDKRLEELMEFKKERGHCDVPISHPGLGIWVTNQRFNIHDMSKERVAALDALGFIWNHNRKKRSDDAWNKQYNNLLEYIKANGHPNVPATHRHSPLGTWVGKQREEYRKYMNKMSSQLDKSRIDRLNAIGFQWSLQQWKVIPWDDRFEELKKFKAQHGHTKIPRNHPYFGNWPIYQRAQYKLFKAGKPAKITKEKIDKLVSIGFFKPLDEVPDNSGGQFDDTYWE